MNLLLITGNKGKLTEWRRLLPPGFTIDTVSVDLDEIQSLDSEAIVADKARRAYQVVQKPVVVEDVSAGLASLNGLPGPFIKFFMKAMGEDALYTLAQQGGAVATVACTVGYYDGTKVITRTATVHGTVVAPRGTNGFGFDKVFIPDGQSKTYGEMTNAQKDMLSHRAQAIRLLAQALQQL